MNRLAWPLRGEIRKVIRVRVERSRSAASSTCGMRSSGHRHEDGRRAPTELADEHMADDVQSAEEERQRRPAHHARRRGGIEHDAVARAELGVDGGGCPCKAGRRQPEVRDPATARRVAQRRAAAGREPAQDAPVRQRHAGHVLHALGHPYPGRRHRNHVAAAAVVHQPGPSEPAGVRLAVPAVTGAPRVGAPKVHTPHLAQSQRSTSPGGSYSRRRPKSSAAGVNATPRDLAPPVRVHAQNATLEGMTRGPAARRKRTPTRRGIAHHVIGAWASPGLGGVRSAPPAHRSQCFFASVRAV